REIAGNGSHGNALGAELLRAVGQAHGVDIDDDELGPGPAEPARHRMADLAHAADSGDEHYLAVEIGGHGGPQCFPPPRAATMSSTGGAPRWAKAMVPSRRTTYTERWIPFPSSFNAR